MKMTGFFTFLAVMALSFCFVPSTMAQVGEVSDEGPSPTLSPPKETKAQAQEIPEEESSGTMVGLQASTNFQEMLAGLKIQIDNFAVTP